MPMRDLAGWRAWYEVEPRGDDRADLHASLVASEIAQVLAAFSGGEPITPAAFLQYLRDHWTPLTKAERERRKQQRTKKWKARLRGAGEALRAAHQAAKTGAKKRGGEPRQDDGAGDS